MKWEDYSFLNHLLAKTNKLLFIDICIYIYILLNGLFIMSPEVQERHQVMIDTVEPHS